MGPTTRRERRRKPGAPEHAAVPGPELLHRPSGHLPEPELGGTQWHNPTSAKSGCSRATSRLRAGCSAKARSCRSRRTRRSSTSSARPTAATGSAHVRPARPAGPRPAPLRERVHPRPRRGGAETVTLTVNQIPAHSHPFLASADNAQATAQARVLATDAGLHALHRRQRDVGDEPSSIGSVRRLAAAQQLPAVPLRRLHHFAFRDLPEPDLRRPNMDPTSSSPRSASSHSTSPRRAGRSATVRSCRSRRTPPSSRSWERRTAGTARATSRCRTCRETRPMHPGQGPGLSPPRSRRDRGIGDRDSPRVGDPAPFPRPRWRPLQPGEDPTGGRRGARPLGRRQPLSGQHERPRRRSPYSALAPAGGDLPHNNMQPYLTLNFCIALQGIFPSRP